MYREYGQVVAVTNRSLTERPFLEQIRRVCEMHPDALLLREKDLSEKEYEELAKEVMAICAEYKVPCILHTFWRVAEKLKCDTVHLPLPILRQFVLEKEPIATQADADFTGEPERDYPKNRHICPFYGAGTGSTGTWCVLRDGRTYLCDGLQKRTAATGT